MPEEKSHSRQLAVALQYDSNADPAPSIIAKGRGAVAEKILELAEEHGIPVRQDASLAETLGKLDLGDYIPAELFPAIAEVLAFVYRMNRDMKSRAGNGRA